MLASASSFPSLLTKVKATDQSVTSSTALVNETDLSIPIGVSETWVIQWTLRAAFVALGMINVAVTTPAAATQLIMGYISPDGNTLAGAAGTTTVSGTAITLNAAGVTGGVVIVTATVVNSTTAGNVTLQFAQNTSSVTATTIKALSSVTARKA